jgi:PAS domain S-box-containing protein
MRNAEVGARPERESDPDRSPTAVGQDHLMALIDHTSAVIYMRDRQGRYLLANREYERLFNVRREEIVGLTDHDLFPTAVADEFRANDLAAFERGEPVQMEEIAPGDDGLRTYITVKFPLMDADGYPYAVCGISTDITDRKRAEDEVRRLYSELEMRVRERTAELEASTRELDAFAYSVSHDLRAPLRSLEGFSEILVEDYADQLDEQGRQYLGRIHTNAARMAQIIDDLLHLSRTTRTELRRERTDLTALATMIVAELRDADPGREVDVHIDGGLIADGDSHLIRLVLQNLLGNAWKFTAGRTRAEVRLTGARQDDVDVFTIADNGAGFDMRQAQMLFEPFQRLHSAADFEGSGIGLAIVYRVITRHGGRIRADSSPGNGATFAFSLTPAPPGWEIR